MTKNKESLNPGDMTKCRICGHPVKVVGYRYMPALNKDFLITSDCLFCSEQENLRKEKELTDRLIRSNLGAQYAGLDFSQLEDVSPSFALAKQSAIKYQKAIHICKNKGLGMYLFGDNGRGKTALAACILRAAATRSYSVYSTNLTEVVEKLFNNKIKISFLKEVDFLLIDDIGSERMMKADSEGTYVSEKANEIITEREKNLKSTLFTSNLKISELGQVGYSKKTIERIYSMSSRIFEIETPESYRIKKTTDLPF